MKVLFDLCYQNLNSMKQSDKDFLEYLSKNWPNYDNDWLFEILLDLKEKYKL